MLTPPFGKKSDPLARRYQPKRIIGVKRYTLVGNDKGGADDRGLHVGGNRRLSDLGQKPSERNVPGTTWSQRRACENVLTRDAGTEPEMHEPDAPEYFAWSRRRSRLRAR